MAATDERAIHEFPTGTIDENSLLIMDRPTSIPGEYETEKFAIANLALKLLGGIDFPNNLDTAEKDIFGAINELHGSIGADAYDDTATYAVGDLCIYNNTLYKCTTAIPVAEAWNANHWAQTSIADEISKLTEMTVSVKSGQTITVKPRVFKCGRLIICHFFINMPAGTYDGAIWQISNFSTGVSFSFRNVVRKGTEVYDAYINTSGEICLNSITFATGGYLSGEIVAFT